MKDRNLWASVKALDIFICRFGALFVRDLWPPVFPPWRLQLCLWLTLVCPRLSAPLLTSHRENTARLWEQNVWETNVTLNTGKRLSVHVGTFHWVRCGWTFTIPLQTQRLKRQRRLSQKHVNRGRQNDLYFLHPIIEEVSARVSTQIINKTSACGRYSVDLKHKNYF